MNAKRVFFVIIGCLGMLVMLAVAGIYFGNAMLQKQSHKLVALKLQSRVSDEQQAALAKAKQNVIKYTPLNTIAQTIVPQDKDQALTVREIVSFADKAGIKIGSITFPASNLGQKKVGSSSGTVSAPSASSSLSQVTPVKGIAGVYQLPITIQSDTNALINFNQLVTFLQSLENNRHTAQVSQLTINPVDASGKRLSFELVVNVYIKP